MTLNETFQRRPPQRILLIKPSALGDVVQTLPLLPALARRFPQARITWLIQRGLEDLLVGHPDLTDIVTYHRNGTWRDGLRLLAELRSRRFDVVFDLQGLLRTGVMTAATLAPVRVGLETAREGSRWTLTHVVPETGRSVPAWERYLRVLDFLEADRTVAQTVLVTSPDDQQRAEELLSGLPRPLLAVHPGARWVTKRWPAEKFAEVLSRASAAWNTGIVLLGSPSERQETEALEHHLSTRNGTARIRNLTGQTNLKQLAAVLERVDAVISNDSGPMHLAAGLGTPTLGIFTCTDAVRSGPGGPLHELVSTEVACRASYRKVCPQSGAGHLACFQELDAARVWSGLKRLMIKNAIIGDESSAA